MDPARDLARDLRPVVERERDVPGRAVPGRVAFEKAVPGRMILAKRPEFDCDGVVVEPFWSEVDNVPYEVEALDVVIAATQGDGCLAALERLVPKY